MYLSSRTMMLLFAVFHVMEMSSHALQSVKNTTTTDRAHSTTYNQTSSQNLWSFSFESEYIFYQHLRIGMAWSISQTQRYPTFSTQHPWCTVSQLGESSTSKFLSAHGADSSWSQSKCGEYGCTDSQINTIVHSLPWWFPQRRLFITCTANNHSTNTRKTHQVLFRLDKYFIQQSWCHFTHNSNNCEWSCA